MEKFNFRKYICKKNFFPKLKSDTLTFYFEKIFLIKISRLSNESPRCRAPRHHSEMNTTCSSPSLYVVNKIRKQKILTSQSGKDFLFLDLLYFTKFSISTFFSGTNSINLFARIVACFFFPISRNTFQNFCSSIRV